MSRNLSKTIGFILTLLLLNSVFGATAQSEQPTARAKLIHIQQREDGRVAARFVITIADGASSSSLDPASVQIEADNQVFLASSVRTLSAEGEMTPLRVVLVIDVTPTMRVDVVQGQLSSVINTLQTLNDTQIGMVTFSDQVLQRIPLTDDFERIRTAIDELAADTSLTTTDVNTVILGVQAGVDLLDTAGQERHVLILLTDTVDTQPNQAAIQDVISAANEHNTAIYTLPLPESGSGRTVEPNLSLPQALADATDGFVFPYLSEGRTHLDVSSELARNLGLLSSVLVTEYEAVFNLRGANLDTQTSLAVTLQLDLEGILVEDRATIEYSEPQYTATLVDGDIRQILNDGSPVTGNVTLQFQTEPALPDRTRFQFTVDGEPLACDSTNEPVCIWNTTFGTQPRFYAVEAAAIDSDDMVVARVETLLNVYRSDLEVSLPSSLLGQVPIGVNIVGYEQLADQAELWLVNGEDAKRVDLQSLGNAEDGHITLYLDVEQDVYNNTSDNTSRGILLRVDLRNVGLNSLIARREIEATVNPIPDYEISFVGENLTFSPQITYLPLNNEPYQLSAEIAPALSNITDEQFVLLLDRNDGQGGEFLTATTNAVINYVWNTSLLAPGLYRLGAAVVREIENVEPPIILTAEWQTINLYRAMESSTVLYSQREGDTLYGENQITVSTVIIPDAAIIAVYAGDELVASTAVDDDGETSLLWDINRTIFAENDTQARTLDVRVDILAQDGTTVLGRRQENLTLRPTPDFELVITGIAENDTLTDRREITAQLEPELSSLEVAYLFFAQPVGGQEGEAVIEQNGTQTAIWNVSSIPPGRYTFSVQAYDRSTLDQPNPQPLATFDTTVSVIKTPDVSGDFTDDVFVGENELQVQNYPNVARVVVQFLPEGAESPITIIDGETISRGSQTTLKVDWQDNLFNEEQGDKHGLVIVGLQDQAGENLYIWVQARTIQYDTRVEIFPWRAAIWALFGVMAIGLIVPLRRRWAVIRNQNKRPAGNLRQTIQTDGQTCTVSWRDPDHNIFDGIEVHSTVTLSIGRREMWWEPDIAFSSRTVSRRLGTMTLLEGGPTLKLNIPKAHHTRIMINSKLMSEYIEEGYAMDDSYSYENQMLTFRRTSPQVHAEYVIAIGGTQARPDQQCAITVML